MRRNIGIKYVHKFQVSHLHLHHLVFALWAEGPLIRQGIMVISALVAIQCDGVAWQLDDLNNTTENTSF